MKNINLKNDEERVEVMALFGYEMTPCQPLSFKRRGETEVEVTEMLGARMSFSKKGPRHIFDVLAGRERFVLSFNPADLSWVLARA